jgi:hypothetical protein
MPDTFIEMTFEEWEAKYKPIYNHLAKGASFQDETGKGIMFETYGEEVEFVKSQDPNKIWMYGDGDDGGGYLWSGWGFINRLGYFITEVPFEDNVMIQVQVAVPMYFCEGCEEEWEDEGNLISDKWSDLEKCPKCATIEIPTTPKEN